MTQQTAEFRIILRILVENSGKKKRKISLNLKQSQESEDKRRNKGRRRVERGEINRGERRRVGKFHRTTKNAEQAEGDRKCRRISFEI